MSIIVCCLVTAISDCSDHQCIAVYSLHFMHESNCVIIRLVIYYPDNLIVTYKLLLIYNFAKLSCVLAFTFDSLFSCLFPEV